MAKAMAAKKQVQVIARIQFKSDPRKVVYLVRSSDGVSQHETTLFDGKATSCTCASRCSCYHEKGCEKLEQARENENLKTVQEAVKCESDVEVRFSAKSVPSWLTVMVAKGLVQMPSLPVAKSLPVELKGRGKQLRTTDLSTKGVLNGNRGFSLMKVS